MHWLSMLVCRLEQQARNTAGAGAETPVDHGRGRTPKSHVVGSRDLNTQIFSPTLRRS